MHRFKIGRVDANDPLLFFPGNTAKVGNKSGDGVQDVRSRAKGRRNVYNMLLNITFLYGYSEIYCVLYRE